MKLQTKLNLVSVFILLLDGSCHVTIGAYVITNILYNLNRNILAGELHNRVTKISETYKVLKDAGLSGTASYVESAQNEIIEDLKKYKYGETGGVLIANTKDKKIVYQPQQSENPETSAAASYIDEMIEKKTGSMKLDQSGTSYYAAFETFPEWNWVVALSITTAEMLAKRSQYLQNVSIVAIFILLLNSFVLRGFGRKLTARIETTLTTLKQVESGDLSARIPNIVDKDEIATLQQGVNSMISVIQTRTDEIARARDTLEIRVQERTAQLAEKSAVLKEELRNSSNLLNSMKQVVFAVDRSGTIIPPVSKSSEAVFGMTIEGKNILESIYKDLDRRSETFSALNSAFVTVFGEDALQWELTEDNFPKQFTYSVNDAQRTLKASYSPMWNDQGQLEKIMLVIEDITSLIELEKNIAAAKAAAAKNMQMIQELGANQPDELEGFFSGAFNLMTEAKTKVRGQDPSASSTVLRNLHTLKGNARVFGLSRISSAAHEAENQMHEIKPSELPKAEATLADVQGSVFEYADLARKIYHAANGFYEQMSLALHTSAAHADLRLSELDASPSSSQASKDAQKALDEMQIAAKSLREIDLAATVAEVSHVVAQEPTDVEALGHAWEKLSDLARARANSFNPWHAVDNEAWVSVFMAVHRCAQLVHGGTAKKSERSRAFTELAGLCAPRQLDYFAFLATWLGSDSVTAEMEQAGIRTMWNYVRLVSQLQSARTLSREKVENAAADIETSDLILGKVFKNLRAEKSSLENFFKVSGTRTEDWLATDHEVESLKTVAKAISDGSDKATIKGMLAEILKQTNRPASTLIAFFEEGAAQTLKFHYLKSVEVLRLLKPTFEKTTSTAKRTRVIEVPERGYSELKQMLAELRARGKVKDAKFDEVYERFDRLADLPIIPTLQKLVPMVRDVAERLGKKVEFKVVGDEMTLSREKLNALNDAMVHLVRNALDHGIESPEERRAHGKKEAGVIEVECVSTGKNLTVRIADDGKGIDPDAVANAAAEKGLVDRAGTKRMNDEQKMDLIFLPGLSTKSDVTDVSGRGIGMDVVKKNVESLGGSVKVKSRLGQGTQVVIQLSTVSQEVALAA
jgi:chemotaxis protein histidine kinase CheA/methyl-accepting chemotaxis protein